MINGIILDHSLKTTRFRGIKQDCLSNLNQGGIRNPRVYLISSPFRRNWDFPSLCDDLLGTFPILKRKALTLSLSALSNGLVIKKRKILHRRVVKTALLATIDPVRCYFRTPGINVNTLVKEISFYKKQFGLDEPNIHMLQLMIIDCQKRNNFVHTIGSFRSQGDAIEWIVELHKEYKEAGIAYQALVFLPIVGQLIPNSAISFYLTIKILKTILKRLEDEGKMIVRMAGEHQMMDMDY